MARQQPRFPLLLVCGPSAGGKSSVAWEVYWSLGRAGVAIAHLDLDGVGYGPPPSSFGTWDIKIINAGSVWQNYRAAGARCFVISGLPALREQIEKCVRTIPDADPTVCVLMVSEEEQRERIFRRAVEGYGLERGGGSAVQTPEALKQTAAAAARELVDEVEPIPNAVVLDSVGVSVQEVARNLLSLTNWPDGLPAGASTREHSH